VATLAWANDGAILCTRTQLEKHYRRPDWAFQSYRCWGAGVHPCV